MRREVGGGGRRCMVGGGGGGAGLLGPGESACNLTLIGREARHAGGTTTGGKTNQEPIKISSAGLYTHRACTATLSRSRLERECCTPSNGVVAPSV